MRLYLSSESFGNHADRLLEMMGENKKVLFISNAKDYMDKVERAEHIKVKRLEFEQVGLTFEELDLRDYFGKKKELAQKLEGIGLLFMSGGNTFILRRAMQYSGLDRLLIEYLMQDKFVYAGSSAGSIVAAPSLHGTEHGDPPDVIPDRYDEDVVWSGLHLVDFYIIPHFLSDGWGAESQMMKEYFEERELPYKTLMDGQVYVVEGTRQELLT